jgi:hypothetical protein
MTLLEQPPARLLQRHIVIGCQVVEPDDGEAVAQQTVAEMKADEARGTGDERSHGL